MGNYLEFKLSMSVAGPIMVLFVVSCFLAIEPFALFHFTVFDYVCFTVVSLLFIYKVEDPMRTEHTFVI